MRPYDDINSPTLLHLSSSDFIEGATGIIVPNTAEIINITSRPSPSLSGKLDSVKEETTVFPFHPGIEISTPSAEETNSRIITAAPLSVQKRDETDHLDEQMSEQSHTENRQLQVEIMVDCVNPEEIQTVEEGGSKTAPPFKSDIDSLTLGEVSPQRRKNSAERRKEYASSVRKAREAVSLGRCCPYHADQNYPLGTGGLSAVSLDSLHLYCSYCLCSLQNSESEDHANKFSKSCTLRDSERSGARSLSLTRCSNESEDLDNLTREKHFLSKSKYEELNDKVSDHAKTKHDESPKHSRHNPTREKHPSHGEQWSVSSDKTESEGTNLARMSSQKEEKSDEIVHQGKVPHQTGEKSESSSRGHYKKHPSKKRHRQHNGKTGSHQAKHIFDDETEKYHLEKRHHRKRNKRKNVSTKDSLEKEKHRGVKEHDFRHDEYRKESQALFDSAEMDPTEHHRPLTRTDSIQTGVLYVDNNTNNIHHICPGCWSAASKPHQNILDNGRNAKILKSHNDLGRLSLVQHEDDLMRERLHFNSVGLSGATSDRFYINGPWIDSFIAEDELKYCQHHSSHNNIQPNNKKASTNHWDDDTHASILHVSAEIHERCDQQKDQKEDTVRLFETKADPEKHPLQDSAYQSKVQSTEKNNSKPGSDIVSPQLGSGVALADSQQVSGYKFVSARLVLGKAWLVCAFTVENQLINLQNKSKYILI